MQSVKDPDVIIVVMISVLRFFFKSYHIATASLQDWIGFFAVVHFLYVLQLLLLLLLLLLLMYKKCTSRE